MVHPSLILQSKANREVLYAPLFLFGFINKFSVGYAGLPNFIVR